MELKDIAEIGQSVSLIIASLFAIYGLDAWRREFVGKRRMELAEEVLALFYQARDAIDAARSPLGFGGEGSSRKPSANENPEDKEALDSAYVIVERLQSNAEVFSRIHVLRYRFMAQLGADAALPFDKLWRIRNELLIAASRMARLATRKEWQLRTDDALEKHHKEHTEVSEIVWGGFSEDDPITRRVNAIVNEVETTCRAVIESKGTLFALINLKLQRWRAK